jgi:hypothetical protein
MNPRIVALKQAAGIQDNPDQEGLDLFAELIVRECAFVVDNDGSSEDILENFGVK